MHQGTIFLVIGSTTILLTLFAARAVYDFFNPSIALAGMFFSAAFVAATSVQYKNKSLALTGMFLAAVAPLFTNSPVADYVGLFTYLIVVVLGIIWVVALTEWRDLTAVGLLMVSFYSFAAFVSAENEVRATLLLFAYAFGAIFFASNVVGLLRAKSEDMPVNLIVSAWNGLFILVWITTAAKEEWKSLIIIAWMIGYLIAAFGIFKVTQKREPFCAYSGVAIAFLAAATAVELHNDALVVAYTIEAGAISILTYFIMKNIATAQRASLMLVFPILLSYKNFVSTNWDAGIFNNDSFVIFTLSFVLLGLGAFFLPRVQQLKDEESIEINTVHLVMGSIYLGRLLWIIAHVVFESGNIAVMVCLVLYTLAGLGAYFQGIKGNINRLKIYGGVLVGTVVFRLLMVDIWQMSLAGRIVTFFLIGALLVSTAFFGGKKK